MKNFLLSLPISIMTRFENRTRLQSHIITVKFVCLMNEELQVLLRGFCRGRFTEGGHSQLKHFLYTLTHL